MASEVEKEKQRQFQMRFRQGIKLLLFRICTNMYAYISEMLGGAGSVYLEDIEQFERIIPTMIFGYRPEDIYKYNLDENGLSYRALLKRPWLLKEKLV